MPALRALPGRTRIEHVEGGETTLHVDARHAKACAALWHGGQVTTLAVTENENPGLKSLEFLEDFFPIPALDVMLFRRVDLQMLERASLKRYFSNDGFNNLGDLSRFPQLEFLGHSWHAAFDARSAGPALGRLALTGFRPKDGDLRSLEGLHRLTSLSLVATSVASLAGLETMESLLDLSVSSAPKLNDISAFAALRNLQTLKFDACKSLQGVAETVRAPSLRELQFMNCSALTSLSFVRQLPALEVINFLDTDVADGDMSPLLDHPALKRVVFTKKKHFSMSHIDVMRRRQRNGALS